MTHCLEMHTYTRNLPAFTEFSAMRRGSWLRLFYAVILIGPNRKMTQVRTTEHESQSPYAYFLRTLWLCDLKTVPVNVIMGSSTVLKVQYALFVLEKYIFLIWQWNKFTFSKKKKIKKKLQIWIWNEQIYRIKADCNICLGQYS